MFIPFVGRLLRETWVDRLQCRYGPPFNPLSQRLERLFKLQESYSLLRRPPFEGEGSFRSLLQSRIIPSLSS